MAVVYWILALLMGAPIGVGVAFMILSAILNKSNNMGDSRAEIRDFSSEIVYLSQENNMKHNIQLFVSYTDMNYEMLTKSRDYLDRAANRLHGHPGVMVSRYIPGADGEADSADPADSGVSEGITTSAIPVRFAGALFGRGAQPPAESAWAAARRKNLGQSASENPWGRDANWGASAQASGTTEAPQMDLDMTMDTGAEKKKPTQAEIDAFWSGGKKAASSQAEAAPADPAAAVTPDTAAMFGGASAGADVSVFGAASPDPFSTAFGADASVPSATPDAPEEPVYDAPTATRPVWLNGNPNDDFSDFDDV